MGSGLAITGFIWILASTLGAKGFGSIQVGDVVDNIHLPALGGEPRNTIPVLDHSSANVFIFFRPNHDHSRDALKVVATLEKEMATVRKSVGRSAEKAIDRSIRWIAIVSDRHSVHDVQEEVRAAGIQMPVLIDTGDTYYGKLGVRLHPYLGITDRSHRLTAALSYLQVNFETILSAHIQHTLGEISDDELDKILHPAPPTDPSADPKVVARHQLHLGEALFRAKNYVRAAEYARSSIEKDPTLQPAYRLLGLSLEAQNLCDQAIPAFEAALKLDATDVDSRMGLERCKSKHPLN